MGTALKGIWNFWKGSREAGAEEEKRIENGRKSGDGSTYREGVEKEGWVVLDRSESGDEFN